ncbi:MULTISPECIES: MFS transporter [unclassified Roseitalea]|uniref:MFS transporter n=1 Tax=unclassified Roseitalea TaxID=2639107 RepID=UPI00273F7D20|nr:MULTISPECIES: MFS transporter [unclassified Roseitalea]
MGVSGDGAAIPATPGGAAARRRALTVILLTILINMIGVGLAWPILPKLVQSMGSGAVSEAAAAYAVIGTIYALAQFLFGPLIGMLSDRFGRRPVMLVSLAGLAADYVFAALAPNLVWLAFARLLGGILGATLPTANAYVTDISEPADRARIFGLIGAAFGLGFILGPLIGGVLGAIDIRLPFWAAAAMAAVNLVLAWAFLPESLAPQNRRTDLVAREANPLASLRKIGRFPALTPLLIALLITATAQRGLEATWVLYTEFRFGWTVRDAAFSLAFVGVMYVIVQGGLVGPVVRLVGDWRTVIAGFAISCVSLAFYGLADHGWMVYPLIAGYVLGNGLGAPALTALCSKSVDDDRQGQLQGTLQAVNALAIILGPLLASLVLAHVSAPDPVLAVPGLWFIAGAVAFIVSIGLALRARPATM